MEHEKGNFNDFNSDDDFEKMLEEKTKGWQKPQSIPEILDTLKPLSILSDEKVQQRAASVAESVSQSSSLTETPEVEEALVSSDALSVVESTDNESTDNPAETRKPRVLPRVEHIVPHSDPAYSQSIIEGKATVPVIRGIRKGPWTNPTVVNQAVSQEEALKNIGHPDLADFWRRITAAAQQCNGDIDKVIHQIGLLQKAAFYQNLARQAWEAELKRIIETGSEAERARAEAAYAKMYRESGKLSSGKNKTSSTERAPKAEKLLVGTQKTIDLMVSYRMSYDMLVAKLKEAGKLNGPALDYIKTIFKKGAE